MQNNYFWRKGFQVFDNVVFFIQGNAPDQWTSPPSLKFSDELLAALTDYHDMIDNGYTDYVIEKVFEVESEDEWAGKWNVIMYSRTITVPADDEDEDEDEERITIEMLLANFESKVPDVRFVIPCRMITPAHMGANKVNAVDMISLDRGVLPNDVDFNLIRRPRQKFLPSDFKLGDYLDSINRAKTTFLDEGNFVYGHHNIIIQGKKANEWVQDQRANRQISNFIANFSSNFTIITPEPMHSYRLYWQDGTQTFMYAEETDERQGYTQKYLRIIIYCHLLTPSHSGSPGKSASFALRSILVPARRDPFHPNTPIRESNPDLNFNLQTFASNQLNWKKNPPPPSDPMELGATS